MTTLLCTKLSFCIDAKKRCGMLGIVCNDTTLWVWDSRGTKFLRELLQWVQYSQTHPDYTGLSSSHSFMPALAGVDGPWEGDTFYEFAAEAVRSAVPLIEATLETLTAPSSSKTVVERDGLLVVAVPTGPDSSRRTVGFWRKLFGGRKG
jgi:hypothetical protein